MWRVIKEIGGSVEKYKDVKRYKKRGEEIEEYL